jgi:hypothetical protein
MEDLLIEASTFCCFACIGLISDRIPSLEGNDAGYSKKQTPTGPASFFDALT